MVNGTKRTPKAPGYADWAAANQAAKKPYCHYCDYSAFTKQKLEVHEGGPKHLNAVAAAEAAAIAAASSS